MKHIERFAVVIALILVAGTLALGNARTSGALTSAAGLRRAPSATLPPPIQAPVAGEATYTASYPPAPRASGRHPRPEEIVRLPAQIQDQVAATVLTPAAVFSEAEILTLPWQIQDQVRQAYQAATT